jgi:UDP-glucose 4-epimerase
VNVSWTRNLAEAAAAAAVPVLVWLSSIKVLGDVSAEPLAVDAPYAPAGAYAASKAQAEQALLDTAVRHTRVAVVRPPLVYGPEVRGNFLALMRWTALGAPLPLAGARAQRSLVGVHNLVSLLLALAEPRSGTGGVEIYHVADDEDLAVAELIRRLGAALGRRPRLWYLPEPWLHAAARITGRESAFDRLFRPLRVCQAATRERLGWVPPHSIDHELGEAARWYQRRR